MAIFSPVSDSIGVSIGGILGPGPVVEIVPLVPYPSICLKFTAGNPGLKFMLGDEDTVFDLDAALSTDQFVNEVQQLVRSHTSLIIGTNDTSQIRACTFRFGVLI
jgi:hypothetical protein